MSVRIELQVEADSAEDVATWLSWAAENFRNGSAVPTLKASNGYGEISWQSDLLTCANATEPEGDDYWDDAGRCKHCGAGDDNHHSFTCPTGKHHNKQPETDQ